ncbi:unnamed protein product [Moneuplotes crassus]|uniref:Uncharacterized protein n=1 Tax=Euplotes crassus TaxID=5936 RepID=A0AAD1UAW2_EUPCR|nr:unnamed protein product [Moneuplotes crassus]
MRKGISGSGPCNLEAKVNDIPSSFIQIREYLDSPSKFMKIRDTFLKKYKHKRKFKGKKIIGSIVRYKKPKFMKPKLTSKKNMPKIINNLKKSLSIKGQKSIITPKNKSFVWSRNGNIMSLTKHDPSIRYSSQVPSQEPFSSPTSPVRDPAQFLYEPTKTFEESCKKIPIGENPKRMVIKNEISSLSQESEVDILSTGQFCEKLHENNTTFKLATSNFKEPYFCRPQTTSKLKKLYSRKSNRSDLVTSSSKFFIGPGSVEHCQVKKMLFPATNVINRATARKCSMRQTRFGPTGAARVRSICPSSRPKKYLHNTNVKLIFEKKQRQKKFGTLERKVNKILVKKSNSKSPKRSVSVDYPENEPKASERVEEIDSDTINSPTELTRIQISAVTKQKSRTRCRIKMSTSKIFSEVSYSSKNDYLKDSHSFKRNSDIEIQQIQTTAEMPMPASPPLSQNAIVMLNADLQDTKRLYAHKKFVQQASLKPLLKSLHKNSHIPAKSQNKS